MLSVRRYGLRFPPVLDPTSRLAATGVTIFTGYPFLRALVGGRAAGTDALVSVATIASLALRENVVALTVVNAVGLLVSASEAMSPVVVAILHNASSVVMMGNSARLIRYQLAGRSR